MDAVVINKDIFVTWDLTSILIWNHKKQSIVKILEEDEMIIKILQLDDEHISVFILKGIVSIWNIQTFTKKLSYKIENDVMYQKIGPFPILNYIEKLDSNKIVFKNPELYYILYFNVEEQMIKIINSFKCEFSNLLDKISYKNKLIMIDIDRYIDFDGNTINNIKYSDVRVEGVIEINQIKIIRPYLSCAYEGKIMKWFSMYNDTHAIMGLTDKIMLVMDNNYLRYLKFIERIKK